MTLQRGLAVQVILNLPLPSALLQPPYCAHTLGTLCAYTYICVTYCITTIAICICVLVYARFIFAHDHAQRGLYAYWVLGLIYMYMHLLYRALEDHWLYIALLLWTCVMAFASGLLIGFIWILLI